MYVCMYVLVPVESRWELWRKASEALELEFLGAWEPPNEGLGKAFQPSARAAGTFNSGGVSPAKKFYNNLEICVCVFINVYLYM